MFIIVIRRLSLGADNIATCTHYTHSCIGSRNSFFASLVELDEEAMHCAQHTLLTKEFNIVELFIACEVAQNNSNAGLIWKYLIAKLTFY